MPPRFRRCRHRCARRSHLSAGSPRSPRDARAGRRLRRGTAGVLVAAGAPQRAVATPREVDRRFGYLHRASSEVGGSGSICGRVSGRAKERLERLGVQPEARERGAAQAAGACSARTLTPACLWMACASSEAGGHHGAVRPPQPRRLRTFRAPSRYARYSRYTQK